MFKNACLGLMTRPGPLPAHQGKSDDGILDGISEHPTAGWCKPREMALGGL